MKIGWLVGKLYEFSIESITWYPQEDREPFVDIDKRRLYIKYAPHRVASFAPPPPRRPFQLAVDSHSPARFAPSVQHCTRLFLCPSIPGQHRWRSDSSSIQDLYPI